MAKNYWVIVREKALYKHFGRDNMFKLMFEAATLDIPDKPETPAAVAAFQFKDAEAFKKVFGDTCWITENPERNEDQRQENMNTAEALGFDIDSTTSGWVPWWE